MNTAMQRLDAAVERLLDIHDSRSGRDMTRNQTEGFTAARRDLSAALAEADQTIGSYARTLAERTAATEDPELSERYVRELRRVTEREQLVRAAGGWGEAPRVESSSMSRPDGYDFDALIKTFRNHGYAAVDIEPSEMYTTRALQSAGGSAVPTTFSDQIAYYSRTMSPMLNGSIVTLENRPTGGPIVFPRLTADASTGGTVTAEGASITVADPTISSVTITPKGYKLINVWSRELDTDEAIGLRDIVARSTARQLALSAGAKLTTDTGTDAYGIVARAQNGGTALGTASGTSLDGFASPADLIDLKYTRAADVRARGAYMVSTTMLAKMRKYRDANGAFMLNPTIAGGVPTFDGSPVHENPALDAVASASKSVLYGDFSAYFTVRVSPIRIEMSLVDAYFGTDSVGLRVVDRVSGDMPDVTAAAYLVSASS